MADTWKRLRDLALRSNEIQASLEDQDGLSIDDAAEEQSKVAREMSEIILRYMTKLDNRFYIPVEQRAELQEYRDITLNGHKAVITGVLNDFATVCQLPDGLRVEFSWWTVRHVINNNNGEFSA